MHVAHWPILFAAAILAGAINSVAGGGAAQLVSALLFVGIPPVNANATNTVALWPGQPASVWAYRHEFRSLPRRVLVPLTVTGILGGVLGAKVLLITPPATFMILVPWLLLIATLTCSPDFTRNQPKRGPLAVLVDQSDSMTTPDDRRRRRLDVRCVDGAIWSPWRRRHMAK